jgi:diacylglycerol kinase (ATP)
MLKSFKKLVQSFGYAFNGLGYAAKTQFNFRVHLMAMLIAVFAGYALHISTNEWQWIALSIALVLITELLNTALESLTDLASPGYNQLAGRVKDIGAGAVVVAAVFALINGCIIFIPKLLVLIHHAA